jgi:pimeloyl-ACP methyl ester carboxylesterase
MKSLYTIILGLLIAFGASAQTAKLPYPIIFLHGLVSSDATWDQAVAALGGSAKVFDVCLNHDGNTSTASLTTSDITVVGWRDGTTTPSANRLYVMNYDQTRFSASGHSTHLQSNQSAIYKQGVAVKAMIQAVLNIEGADKVILVGHSMGGLESREYLQRGYDGTSTGQGTNWVDQTSSQGHRVARLVTTGTPHLGSNATGTAATLAGIDEKSEACRDLRYPSNKVVSPFNAMPAPYLFGGIENTYQWGPTSTANPYNYDFNCNGSSTDAITALNSGTTYNGSMPLPLNIWYTYITSNASSGTDGLVETARQWLYSGSTPTPATADTILLTINHVDEPNNILSIIRGLDEPNDTAFAYTITPGQATKGFITPGMNWNTTDKDVFRVMAPSNGSLSISLVGSGSGIDSLAVFTSTGELSRKAAGDGTTNIVISSAVAGQAYYVYVRGTATNSTYLHPYSVTATLTPTSVQQSLDGLPNPFQLFQNYPNPFNPSTVISYHLSAAGNVSLKVYDMLGKEIATLVQQQQSAGTYSVQWNAVNIPSGMYFCRLTADGYSKTIKISILR